MLNSCVTHALLRMCWQGPRKQFATNLRGPAYKVLLFPEYIRSCLTAHVLAGAAQAVCDKFGMRPVDVARLIAKNEKSISHTRKAYMYCIYKKKTYLISRLCVCGCERRAR